MSGDLPIVDGSTRLYVIIGHPIAQVRSPQTYTPRFRAKGLNALMVPVHVAPDQFDVTVRGLKEIVNLDGIIITVPYKSRVIPFADRLLPTGEKVGAVNALRREKDGSWTGDMFDGRGLTRTLRDDGHVIEGKRVMLIGAGGAGSAVAVAVADAGASAITIFDVDTAKAKALAARVSAAYPGRRVVAGAADAKGHDIVINATPIGMAKGDGMPADLGPLDPALLVIDVIMKPEPTPFLRHAQGCGCRTVDGRAMLEGQIEEVLGFFGLGS